MDATALVEKLRAQKRTITTAESCTGGLVAAALTNISGSSAIFRQGIISYANEAKISLLGVNKKTLETFGAVSEETATEMAEGARKNAQADIAIAVTGIAGPTGGTPEKPVGLVFIAVSSDAGTKVEKHMFAGDRAQIRSQAVDAALTLSFSTL